MSNWKYQNDFYNKEIKNEFIQEKWDGKEDSRIGFFRKSAKLETKFNKDLYNFNKDELDSMLYAFNASTENSFRSQLSTLTNYLEWAINKGYRKENNPLPPYTNEYYGKFIKTKKGKFVTFEMLVEGSKNCVNPQDAVIPFLMWYGISGTNSNELSNLKIKDINYSKNMILVSDIDDNFRTVFVDDYTIKLIKKAAEQIYYVKANGKMKKKEGSYIPDSAVLAQTGYLIKPVNTNNEVFKAVEHNIIAKRFDIFKEASGLPNITPLTVIQSKHIYDAWKIKKQKGYITEEDLIKIGEENGLKPTKVNGKEQINVNRFKPYITDEIMKELYGSEENKV